MILAVGVGVAAATIPDQNGLVHACYRIKGGALRVIDPGAGGACASGENSLGWSQTPAQGAQGPPGPQGVQGVQGAQGVQGPQGLAGVTQDPSTMIVVDSVAAAPNIGGFFKQVSCPQGTKVLWGAWEWSQYTGSMPPADMESFPGSDTAWDFAVGASNQSKNTAAFLIVGCAVAR